MQDCSTIRRVRVSQSAHETNRLLADGWVLLDASSFNGRAQFVLGREFDFEDCLIRGNVEGDRDAG